MLKTRSLHPVAPATEPSNQGSELPFSSAATASYPKIAALAVLFLLAVFALFPHLKTGFTTKDDTEYALYAAHPSQWISIASGMAVSQGRFYQQFSMIGDFAVHYFSNPACYYSVYLGSILLNVGLFYYLLRHILRSELAAFLAAAFSLTFLQNNWYHSVITSSPFIQPFAFSCLMLTFLCFFRWQETMRLRFAVLTGILYFLSLLIYESFVPYVLLFALGALYPANSRRDGSWKQKLAFGLKALSPIVVTLVVYLACYVGYRAAHPSRYEGSNLALGSISRVIAVVWRYTSSTLPGYFYFKDPVAVGATFDGYSPHLAGISELLTNCRVEWLVKAVIAAALSAFLLHVLRQESSRPSLLWRLVAGTGAMFLPICLLGFTAKYQDWVLEHGSLAHSPSYFAYFGTILLIVTLLLAINKAIAQWRLVSLAFIIVTAGAVAGSSVATDYYNYYITLDQQLSHLKWRAIDRLIETADFKAVRDDSVIFAPSLWRYRGIVANAETYWTDYISQKAGKRIQVAHTAEQFKAFTSGAGRRPGYFLAFEQEPKEPDQFIVFSRINETDRVMDGLVYTTEFSLFSYGKNKRFILIGESASTDRPLQVEINGHAEADINGNVFIGQVDLRGAQDDFPKSTIKATAPVDVAHLIVSYFPIEPGKKGVEIIYGRGFHGLEENTAAGLTWNWSLAESELTIVSYSNRPVEKIIKFVLTTFTPRTITFELNGTRQEIVCGTSGRTTVETAVVLQPGENKLHLRSDQPARPPGNGDSRPMAFGIQNVVIEPRN